MKTLRIGTRQSLLALAQSRLIADVIRTHEPEIETELVKIATRGDLTSGPLAAVGGKGQFTAQLESAMRDGSVDLAVHSAKDVPVSLDKEFTIAAVPERADPRDALVSRWGVGLSLLRMGARVGTGSAVTQAATGYWDAGQSTFTGTWTGRPGNTFRGDLDEIAVYDDVLTPTEVTDHYNASR